MALVKDMIDDTLARAVAERDARLWAALILLRQVPLHVASISGPLCTGHPNFRAVDPSASADARGLNRTTASGKVKDAIADAMVRAQAERDGRLWATLNFLQAHMGPVADQPVPDVTGIAPFRASDVAARASQPRGTNRTS